MAKDDDNFEPLDKKFKVVNHFANREAQEAYEKLIENRDRVELRMWVDGQAYGIALVIEGHDIEKVAKMATKGLVDCYKEHKK